MTPELRAELLRLTQPNVSNPCIKTWIANATLLEGYVCGAGQTGKPVQHDVAMSSSPSPDTPVKRSRKPGPGKRVKSPKGA